MSSKENKFSDYQKSECEPRPEPPVGPRDPCPTCVPNDAWVLEKNWFEMSEPWLDEKKCEYNFGYDIGKIPNGPEFKPSKKQKIFKNTKDILTDEQIENVVEESIIAILNFFNKRVNDENVEGLKKVYILETFIHPFKKINKIKVTLPAFNVDILENEDEEDRDTEDPSKSIGSDNVFQLNAEKLRGDLERLSSALKTFEFYYSAYHQVQGSVIHEEGKPLNKVNYTAIRILIKEFIADLNTVLRANGFEILRIFPRNSFGILKTPKIIAFSLDPRDENEFYIDKIKVNSSNGCDEYDTLSKIAKLRSYSKLVPWLSRLDDIINDITAQETRPWLEFTLDYFYPKMTVNYGKDTVDMDEEQKNALACLLENELGIGEGKPLDSLMTDILSLGDIYSYQNSKKDCRDTANIKSESIQSEKDITNEERDVGYREYRDSEMLARFQKRNYNRIIDTIKTSYSESKQKSFLSEKESSSGPAQPPTEEQALKYQRDIIRSNPSGTQSIGEKTIPNSKITVALLKQLYMQQALADAQIELQANKEKWDYYKNSPWLYDAKEAALEELKKSNKVVDQLKDSYKSFGEVETFYDFIGIFGVCGFNKLSGAAIKCLSSGLSLDEFYDSVISLILEKMNVSSFEKVLEGLPENIRRAIEDQVSSKFEFLSISDVLGFTKQQNPDQTLEDIAGKYFKEIKDTTDIMIKYPSFTDAPEEIREEYSWAASEYVDDWLWGSELNQFYSHEYSSWKPTPNAPTQNETEKEQLQKIKEQQRANKKAFARILKDSIIERDKLEIQEATQEFKSFFANGERINQRVQQNRDQTDLFQPDSLRRDEPLSRAERTLIDAQGYLSGSSEVILDYAVAKQIVYGTNDQYEQAVKDYSETNIGKDLTKLFGAIFVEAISNLTNIVPEDDLFKFLKQFPIPDVLINIVEGLVKPCPNQPLFFPPPSKFLNSLKVDVCDPTLQLTFPKLVVPSLDFKSQIKSRVRNKLRNKLIQLYTSTLTRILLKIVNSLEGTLCRSLEAAGGLVSDLVDGDGFGDSWFSALDEAFCGGDRDRSRELNKAIFGGNAELAAKAANIISGVSTTNELLGAMAYPDANQQDDNLNNLISNAINSLAPELSSVLGSPSLVGIAFAQVSSNLTPQDRERIRNLLEEGIPNLPISAAICLTNEQLDEWNDLRRNLLEQKGFDPQAARALVENLNNLTQSALEDFLNTSLDLQTDGGPFLAPIQNEYSPAEIDPTFPSDQDPTIDDVYDAEPPCKDPASILQEVDDLEKDQAQEAIEKDTQLLEEYIKNSYYGKGGIFNEALRDREDKGLNGHALRASTRFLWPNWSNSAEEWDKKREEAGFALGIVMDNGASEGDGVNHIGTFPQTVAAKMREEILSKDMYMNLQSEYAAKEHPPDPLYGYPKYKPSIFFDEIELKSAYIDGDINTFNNTFSLTYVNDQTENDSRRRRGYYEYKVNSTFNPRDQKAFNYYSSIVTKNTLERGFHTKEYSMIIPVDPSEQERKLIQSLGITYGSGPYRDIRKKIFNNLMNKNHADTLGTLDYSSLYESLMNKVTTAVKNASVTDPRTDLTYGFKFGYVPDDLTEEHFDTYTGPNGEEYNYPEGQKVLGKYGNDRIKVLSPEIYGGRYSNPPFWIEPMKQDGWLDATEAIFGGSDGCEPRTKGALTFKDVFDRAKKIEDSLTPDPLLTKDQDCISRRPFNHLVLPETHAGIELNVRSTIRSYASENFLKGLGVYSNFLYNDKNYDSSPSSLIMFNMKETMSDLGSAAGSRRIRIKRKNYWYTFLEQCVQIYQRMIDIDGIKPPPHIQKALQDIGDLQKNFIEPTKKIRKKYFNPDYEWSLPSSVPFYEKDNPNSYNIVDVRRFYHDAIAYRIYGEEMFKTRKETKMTLDSKSFYSLRKIRFFVKIFAIRLVESQCQLVLMELIKSELRILSKKFNNAAYSEAYYTDLLSSLLSMQELFPNSTLTYGTIEPGGDVQSVPSNNLVIPMGSNGPTFIIEKYLRVVDKETNDGVPFYVLNRQQQFRNIIPASTFQDFINSFPQESLVKQDGENLKVSDCFGNLQFTYSVSIKEVLNSIFGSQEYSSISNLTTEGQLSKLKEINPDEIRIRMVLDKHLVGLEYDDFKVNVTEDLMPAEFFENSSLNPNGTVGDLGLFHGIRISVIPAKNSLLSRDDTGNWTDSQLNALPNLQSILEKSFDEKSYLFEDGNIVLPLITSEYSLLDTDIKNLNVSQYDIPCLVNKILEDPLYSLVFEKVFCSKMTLSMAANFCTFGFLAAQGFGEGERNEVDSDPGEADTFDGRHNKKLKTFLRKQFSGFYMSNDVDGQAQDDDDERSLEVRFQNPFRGLELSINMPKIKWFQKLRIKSNPYDSNGLECADPMKDLME